MIFKHCNKCYKKEADIYQCYKHFSVFQKMNISNIAHNKTKNFQPDYLHIGLSFLNNLQRMLQTTGVRVYLKEGN